MLLCGTIEPVYKGTLVHAHEHNPSEQTDPLRTLVNTVLDRMVLSIGPLDGGA